MSTRIEVPSESGVVLLGDATAGLPTGLDQAALLRQLEPLARSSRIFFLVADDPVKYRIDVLANEALPSELEPDFEPHGGAFRLDAPNGRLALIGWDEAGEPREVGSVSVSPGAHQLSIFTRRPFDGKRNAEEQATLLGADAKFVRRVDRLGMIGCLPLVLVGLALLAARWQWLRYLVPLLVLCWLPFFVLRHGRRYQSATRRVTDAELARPHCVISLVPTRQDELRGGYIRV